VKSREILLMIGGRKSASLRKSSNEGSRRCRAILRQRLQMRPAGGKSQSRRVGYDESQLSSIPVEAVLGLGRGNPTALGKLRAGETVVDLGSGGGIDCFLAASKVSPGGKVIGVDMTPRCWTGPGQPRARAVTGTWTSRLGEIESLPVADSGRVSNCVDQPVHGKGACFAGSQAGS